MNTQHWMKTEGKLLRLSNLDKPVYENGFTKRDVLRYYQRIAPAILPHLRGRAITLKRYPNGAQGEHFFEKRCPSHRPEWILPIHYRGIDYCQIDSLPALLWAANLGSIELHPVLSLEREKGAASEMVFDLDPGPGCGIHDCARVAIALARVLEDRGLVSYPKASGSKGIQLYVPLHSGASFEETKHFSHAVARKAERLMPDRVTSVMALRERVGKVYIDWAQNDATKTTICTYSLRATKEPSVSLPLLWSEVRALARMRGSGGAPAFSPERALLRWRSEGDLFSEVLTRVQRLPRRAIKVA